MMEAQRNKKKSHRSTAGTPRSDGPTTHDGEEQTSLPSTSSTDEGTTPDGAKKGKASSRQLQLKLGSKIKIATWNVRSMSAGKLQNVVAEAEKTLTFLVLQNTDGEDKDTFLPLKVEK